MCKTTPNEMPEQDLDKNVKETETQSSQDDKAICKTDLKKSSISVEMVLRIIEVCFIAFASLCVSFMSYRTEQLEYKLNLENSKLHVEVYCDIIDYDDDGNLDTNLLGVKYIDGIYDDFDLQYYSVITLNYYEQDSYEEKRIDVLVPAYFFAGFERGTEDYIYVRLFANNWKKYAELNNYFLYEDEEYSSSYTNINHYVIITYRNIVGDKEKIGYKCGGAGKFKVADPIEIKQYINGLNEDAKIDIDELTPENFLNKVKELSENESE